MKTYTLPNFTNKEKLFRVVKFYFNISCLFPVQSTFIVLLGSLSRILTIAIFVAILKIFLTLVNNDSLKNLKNIIINLTGIADVTDTDIVIAMLLILLLLILSLYISGRACLYFTIIVRKKISFKLSNLPFDLHIGKKRSLALDTITFGYEYLLKLLEILIFMLFITTVILLINIYIGFFIIAITPLFIIHILLKGRKDLHVTNEYLDSKKNLLEQSLSEYKNTIEAGSRNFGNIKKNNLFFQLVGGLVTISVMIVVIFATQGIEITGFKVLFLVFSIRYTIAFASEFSATLAKILAQRTLLSEVSHLSYSELKKIQPIEKNV